MAARRLVALLVALLVLSTVAATLVPVSETSDDETSSSTTTTSTSTTEAATASDDLIERRLALDPDRETIELEATAGDRLQLTVTAERTTEVRVDPLGLIRAVAEGAPARFDLILREPGTVSVRSPVLADPIATFDVAPAPAQP